MQIIREVPLTLDVCKALSTYLHEEHPDKDNAQASLWVGLRGAQRHRSSVVRLREKYCLQAGLEPVHPHALRHTFAARYLNANPGDLRSLARLLGHTSLDTVMIYTEPTMQDLTERMERVEVVNLPNEGAQGHLWRPRVERVQYLFLAPLHGVSVSEVPHFIALYPVNHSVNATQCKRPYTKWVTHLRFRHHTPA